VSVRFATDELTEALEELCRLYDRRFLDSDPLGLVRRFDDPEDREIVGLLAAGLAYGRVASIRASVGRLLAILGPHPSRFIAAFDPVRDARRFDGFVHRFTRGRDVALLLLLVRQARERGGLEALLLASDPDPAAPTLGPALDAFGAALFSLDAGPFARDGRVPRRDGARWLLPVPAGGSACKRSCLFLRWMVRPDDGIDCGVWSRVSRARLVLPLDTHLARVVTTLRWTRRKSPGWGMALDATARLRALDPEDPVRFDFALSRLGILGLLEAPGGRLTVRSVRDAFQAAGVR
jgi:uncharacterized protein (TIGR02757 family)